MTFCLFLFYTRFPNNLITKIVFPGKQGIYLENGIRPPFLFDHFHLITTYGKGGGGGGLIASLDFMLRVALIPRGLIGNLSTDDGDARDDA